MQSVSIFFCPPKLPALCCYFGLLFDECWSISRNDACVRLSSLVCRSSLVVDFEFERGGAADIDRPIAKFQ